MGLNRSSILCARWWATACRTYSRSGFVFGGSAIVMSVTVLVAMFSERHR